LTARETFRGVALCIACSAALLLYALSDLL
jgi:hypothetical protein